MWLIASNRRAPWPCTGTASKSCITRTFAYGSAFVGVAVEALPDAKDFDAGGVLPFGWDLVRVAEYTPFSRCSTCTPPSPWPCTIVLP